MIQTFYKPPAFAKTVSLFVSACLLFTTLAAPFAEGSVWTERKLAAEKIRERTAREENAFSPQSAIPAWRGDTEKGALLSEAEKRRAAALMGISLPENLGAVVESFAGKEADPANGPALPLVIHIQDAHGYYGAQRNAASILKLLSGNAAAPLEVCVEGAWGDVDTSWLEAVPRERVKREIAEELLRDGEISGEEYLSILEGGERIRIYGVEDEEIYRANLKSREMMDAQRAAVLARLEGLEKRMERVKETLFSRGLQALDAMAGRRESGEIDIYAYSRHLRSAAGKEFDEAKYGNLALLSDLMAAESSLSLKGVEAERAQLLKSLEGKLDREGLLRLAQASLAFRTEKIPAERYYGGLIRLAEGSGVEVKEMANYLRYLKKSEELDPAGVVKETAGLSEEIAGRLCAGRKEPADLWRMSRLLRMERRFWEEKLSPRDWREYVALCGEESGLAQIEKYVDVSGGADEAADARSRFLQKAYYRLAFKRNEVMADGTLARAKEVGADRVVLIAGGFHTEGLTELLKRKGVPYVVIRPKLAVSSQAAQPGAAGTALATEEGFNAFVAEYIKNLEALKGGRKGEEKRRIEGILQVVKERLRFAGTLTRDGKSYLLGSFEGERSRVDFLMEYAKEGEAASPLLSRSPAFGEALQASMGALRGMSQTIGELLAEEYSPLSVKCLGKIWFLGRGLHLAGIHVDDLKDFLLQAGVFEVPPGIRPQEVVRRSQKLQAQLGVEAVVDGNRIRFLAREVKPAADVSRGGESRGALLAPLAGALRRGWQRMASVDAAGTAVPSILYGNAAKRIGAADIETAAGHALYGDLPAPQSFGAWSSSILQALRSLADSPRAERMRQALSSIGISHRRIWQEFDGVLDEIAHGEKVSVARGLYFVQVHYQDAPYNVPVRGGAAAPLQEVSGFSHFDHGASTLHIYLSGKYPDITLFHELFEHVFLPMLQFPFLSGRYRENLPAAERQRRAERAAHRRHTLAAVCESIFDPSYLLSPRFQDELNGMERAEQERFLGNYENTVHEISDVKFPRSVRAFDPMRLFILAHAREAHEYVMKGLRPAEEKEPPVVWKPVSRERGREISRSLAVIPNNSIAAHEVAGDSEKVRGLIEQSGVFNTPIIVARDDDLRRVFYCDWFARHGVTGLFGRFLGGVAAGLLFFQAMYVNLDGHHRMDAAQTLGLGSILAQRIDYDDPEILLNRWNRLRTGITSERFERMRAELHLAEVDPTEDLAAILQDNSDPVFIYRFANEERARVFRFAEAPAGSVEGLRALKFVEDALEKEFRGGYTSESPAHIDRNYVADLMERHRREGKAPPFLTFEDFGSVRASLDHLPEGTLICVPSKLSKEDVLQVGRDVYALFLPREEEIAALNAQIRKAGTPQDAGQPDRDKMLLEKAKARKQELLDEIGDASAGWKAEKHRLKVRAMGLPVRTKFLEKGGLGNREVNRRLQAELERVVWFEAKGAVIDGRKYEEPVAIPWVRDGDSFEIIDAEAIRRFQRENNIVLPDSGRRSETSESNQASPPFFRRSLPLMVRHQMLERFSDQSKGEQAGGWESPDQVQEFLHSVFRKDGVRSSSIESSKEKLDRFLAEAEERYQEEVRNGMHPEEALADLNALERLFQETASLRLRDKRAAADLKRLMGDGQRIMGRMIQISAVLPSFDDLDLEGSVVGSACRLYGAVSKGQVEGTEPEMEQGTRYFNNFLSGGVQERVPPADGAEFLCGAGMALRYALHSRLSNLFSMVDANAVYERRQSEAGRFMDKMVLQFMLTLGSTKDPSRALSICQALLEEIEGIGRPFPGEKVNKRTDGPAIKEDEEIKTPLKNIVGGWWARRSEEVLRRTEQATREPVSIPRNRVQKLLVVPGVQRLFFSDSQDQGVLHFKPGFEKRLSTVSDYQAARELRRLYNTAHAKFNGVELDFRRLMLLSGSDDFIDDLIRALEENRLDSRGSIFLVTLLGKYWQPHLNLREGNGTDAVWLERYDRLMQAVLRLYGHARGRSVREMYLNRMAYLAGTAVTRGSIALNRTLRREVERLARDMSVLLEGKELLKGVAAEGDTAASAVHPEEKMEPVSLGMVILGIFFASDRIRARLGPMFRDLLRFVTSEQIDARLSRAAVGRVQSLVQRMKQGVWDKETAADAMAQLQEFVPDRREELNFVSEFFLEQLVPGDGNESSVRIRSLLFPNADTPVPSSEIVNRLRDGGVGIRAALLVLLRYRSDASLMLEVIRDAGMDVRLRLYALVMYLDQHVFPSMNGSVAGNNKEVRDALRLIAGLGDEVEDFLRRLTTHSDSNTEAVRRLAENRVLQGEELKIYLAASLLFMLRHKPALQGAWCLHAFHRIAGARILGNAAGGKSDLSFGIAAIFKSDKPVDNLILMLFHELAHIVLRYRFGVWGRGLGVSAIHEFFADILAQGSGEVLHLDVGVADEIWRYRQERQSLASAHYHVMEPHTGARGTIAMLRGILRRFVGEGRVWQRLVESGLDVLSRRGFRATDFRELTRDHLREFTGQRSSGHWNGGLHRSGEYELEYFIPPLDRPQALRPSEMLKALSGMTASVFHPLRRLIEPLLGQPVRGWGNRLKRSLLWVPYALGEPLYVAPAWETAAFQYAGTAFIPPLLTALGVDPETARWAGLAWATFGFAFAHTIVEWFVRALEIREEEGVGFGRAMLRALAPQELAGYAGRFFLRFALSLFLILPYRFTDPAFASGVTLIIHSLLNFSVISNWLPSWLPLLIYKGGWRWERKPAHSAALFNSMGVILQNIFFKGSRSSEDKAGQAVHRIEAALNKAERISTGGRGVLPGIVKRVARRWIAAAGRVMGGISDSLLQEQTIGKMELPRNVALERIPPAVYYESDMIAGKTSVFEKLERDDIAEELETREGMTVRRKRAKVVLADGREIVAERLAIPQTQGNRLWKFLMRLTNSEDLVVRLTYPLTNVPEVCEIYCKGNAYGGEAVTYMIMWLDHLRRLLMGRYPRERYNDLVDWESDRFLWRAARDGRAVVSASWESPAKVLTAVHSFGEIFRLRLVPMLRAVERHEILKDRRWILNGLSMGAQLDAELYSRLPEDRFKSWREKILYVRLTEPLFGGLTRYANEYMHLMGEVWFWKTVAAVKRVLWPLAGLAERGKVDPNNLVLDFLTPDSSRELRERLVRAAADGEAKMPPLVIDVAFQENAVMLSGFKRPSGWLRFTPYALLWHYSFWRSLSRHPDRRRTGAMGDSALFPGMRGIPGNIMVIPARGTHNEISMSPVLVPMINSSAARTAEILLAERRMQGKTADMAELREAAVEFVRKISREIGLNPMSAEKYMEPGSVGEGGLAYGNRDRTEFLFSGLVGMAWAVGAAFLFKKFSDIRGNLEAGRERHAGQAGLLISSAVSLSVPLLIGGAAALAGLSFFAPFLFLLPVSLTLAFFLKEEARGRVLMLSGAYPIFVAGWFVCTSVWVGILRMLGKLNLPGIGNVKTVDSSRLIAPLHDLLPLEAGKGSSILYLDGRGRLHGDPVILSRLPRAMQWSLYQHEEVHIKEGARPGALGRLRDEARAYSRQAFLLADALVLGWGLQGSERSVVPASSAASDMPVDELLAVLLAPDANALEKVSETHQAGLILSLQQ